MKYCVLELYRKGFHHTWRPTAKLPKLFRRKLSQHRHPDRGSGTHGIELSSTDTNQSSRGTYLPMVNPCPVTLLITKYPTIDGVLALLFACILLSQYPVSTTTTASANLPSSISTMSGKSIHDFTVKDIHGNDVDLAKYKGKVLLVVNVASQCGLTNSNYKELNELYQKYKDQGFEILAFPCNQFAGQEPGTNEQIVEVACTRFKAEFPIFDKVEVNGGNAAPVYKFLKASKGGIFGDSIKWNFTKFLVDKDGRVVDRYAPITSPSKIEKDIKQLLGVS